MWPSVGIICGDGATAAIMVSLVADLGGVPFLLPPISQRDAVAAMVARLHGLVVAGAGNESSSVESDLMVIDYCRRSDRPILGIGYGMCATNVFCVYDGSKWY